MFLSEIKIIYIMSGSNFQRPGSEFGINVFIKNHRHLTVNYRNNNDFTFQMFISFIFGVNTYSSIAHDGFRPVVAMVINSSVVSFILYFT